MMIAYHDLIIETLAESEAQLRERVRSLEQDIEMYRELLYATLNALVEVTRENEMIDPDSYISRAHLDTWRELPDEREAAVEDVLGCRV